MINKNSIFRRISEIKVASVLKKNPRFFIYSLISILFVAVLIFLNNYLAYLLSISSIAGKTSYWPFAEVPVLYTDMIHIILIPIDIFCVVFVSSLSFTALAYDFADKGKGETNLERIASSFKKVFKNKLTLLILLSWSFFYLIMTLMFHQQKDGGNLVHVYVPLLLMRLPPVISSIPPILISNIAGKKKGLWSFIGLLIILIETVVPIQAGGNISLTKFIFISIPLFSLITTFLYVQSFIESEA